MEKWYEEWTATLYGPSKILYVNKNGECKWGIPFDNDGTPLPKGWERVYSDTYKTDYYLNTSTNETQFTKPFAQNHYSPNTSELVFEDYEVPEIIDDSYVRSLSGRYVSVIPNKKDGRTFYRSRSGEKTYDNLPRHHKGTQRIYIREICCDKEKEHTQFPSRMCDESIGHGFASRAAYTLSLSNKSLDGFVEIRNENATGYYPEYVSYEFIRKTSRVIGYRESAAQAATQAATQAARWIGGWFAAPVVEAPRVVEAPQVVERHLSDHDAIILNLQFRTAFEENIPFNIISMNLEGLCRRTQSEKYRNLNYMNEYFYPHIKPGTIMVFQEVVLKDLATKVYKDSLLEIDEAGNQILQVLQKGNPDIPLEFRSDTYTSGILYDTSVWNIISTKSINRLYRGDMESKFSNAYLFQSTDEGCAFWLVNIHLKAPFGTPEHIADWNEKISIATGRLAPARASHHVTNMHITELNNILEKLKEASNDFDTPVYLCGDYNNKISKGYLVKKAIEQIDDFYDPRGEVKL